MREDIEHFRKYPVWMRAVIIIGMSASLWAGIIATMGAL